MKYIYIISCFLIVSCSSVPKVYLETNDLCEYNAPIFTITKEELTFDIKKYGEQLKKKRITLVDSDSLKIQYSAPLDFITYQKTDKQKNITRWIYYSNRGVVKRIVFTYDIYEIYKEYVYNDKGDLKDIIDYDKGYKICWAEAIAIVKKIAKQEIKRYGVTQFYAVHNNLNRGSKTKKALWFVGFRDGNDKLRKYEYKKGAIRYKIDGVTGKFLGTRHIITEHN